MSAGVLYVIVGLICLGVGCLFPLPSFASIDTKGFGWLHRHLRFAVGFFQKIWHLGRTPFALVCLAVYLALKFSWDVVWLWVAFGVAVSIEALIKQNILRPRPYQYLPDAKMLQPRKPGDTSFPSGDALRVWFLIGAALILFPIPWWGAALLCILGVLVSLGRVAMGVHHPSDVIAGTGLGLTLVGIWYLLIF